MPGGFITCKGNCFGNETINNLINFTSLKIFVMTIMKPEIIKISQISPDQSVICILGKDEIPDNLRLSKTEKEYALKQLT